MNILLRIARRRGYVVVSYLYLRCLASLGWHVCSAHDVRIMCLNKSNHIKRQRDGCILKARVCVCVRVSVETSKQQKERPACCCSPFWFGSSSSQRLFFSPCPYHVRAMTMAVASVVYLGRNGTEGSPLCQSPGGVNTEGACGSVTRPRDGLVSGEGSVRGSRRTRTRWCGCPHPLRCVAPAGDPRSWIDAEEGMTDERVVALDEPGWHAGLERWFQH